MCKKKINDLYLKIQRNLYKQPIGRVKINFSINNSKNFVYKSAPKFNKQYKQ